MAQVLIRKDKENEKRHYYTAEEIMPGWYANIKAGHSVEQIHKTSEGKLSIIDPRYCVVGEAWGFSREYTEPGFAFRNPEGIIMGDPLDWKCKTCTVYSFSFATKNVKLHNDKKVETWEEITLQDLEHFAEHMNEEHYDLLVER